ncbi:MAG: hypothetical protein KDD78_16995, partial [Caldilineaceae bacterium]|nr:hypothetical protein [Caldilineaceae bacterium]
RVDGWVGHADACGVRRHTHYRSDGGACQRRRKWVRRQVLGTFSFRAATRIDDTSSARRATAPGTYAGSAWL